MSQGKCFNCGEKGHLSRNCPHKKTAKSSSSKPPGMQTSGIGIDLNAIEQLRDGLYQPNHVELNMIGYETDTTDDETEEDTEPGEGTETPDTSGAESDDDSLPDLESVSNSEDDEEEVARMVNDDHLDFDQESITFSSDEETGYAPGLTSGSTSSDEDDGGEIILTPPSNFGGDIYDIFVEGIEDRMDRIWDEEVNLGRPTIVGSAHARKIDFMLELLAPYPGDPENYLQFEGRRFLSYDVSEDEVVVMDGVRDIQRTMPKRAIERKTFQAGILWAHICSEESGYEVQRRALYKPLLEVDIWAWNAEKVLTLGAPYAHIERHYMAPRRFKVKSISDTEYEIRDTLLSLEFRIRKERLKDTQFDLCSWYAEKIQGSLMGDDPSDGPEDPSDNEPTDDEDEQPRNGGRNLPRARNLSQLGDDLKDIMAALRLEERTRGESSNATMEVNGQQVERGTYPALERNASRRKYVARMVPKPIVVNVKLNGHPVRALIDSGSLGDFVSTTVMQQLGLRKEDLAEAIPVSLAAKGSRSKINYGTTALFQYQDISCDRYFDVMNLTNYDVILGTPFIWQHR
ncbi:hypothetical protein H0H93_010888, partial [Arthromyces matolae]